jgi:hypothetical protein
MSDSKAQMTHDARQQIKKVKVGSPYGHNVVGLTLSILSDAHGAEAANYLIKELKLTEKFGIRPVKT